jgi:glycosyltransferase 2 family protein
VSRPSTSFGWRRILLLVLLVGIAAVVITRFANARKLIETLGRGNVPWIVAGILIHVVYFTMSAELYRLGFDMVGVTGSMLHLLPIVFAGYFVNAAIPSAGAGTAALFIDDAQRRGQSGARTAVGTVLVLLTDLGTMLPFVAYAAWYIYSHRAGVLAGLTGGGVFAAYVVALVGLLLLATKSPNWLRHVIEYVRRAVNHVAGWLHREPPLGSGWVETTVEEFAEAGEAVVTQPRKLLKALGWGLLMHGVNLAGLYTFFLAFGEPLSFGVLVAGFAMGIVFFVITVVPQIVAAVEGIMLLIFTAAGVPAAKVGAVVVVFRGVTFWLPVLIGFVSLRYVSTFRPRSDEGGSAPETSEKAGDKTSDEKENRASDVGTDAKEVQAAPKEE